MAAKTEDRNAVYARTRPSVAWVFGVKTVTVDQWLRDGCPRRTAAGYDLRAIYAWHKTRNAAPDDDTLRFWRKEREAITVKRLRGELMDRAEHDRRLATLARIFAAHCERMPRELGATLQVKPDVIREYVDVVRKALAVELREWERAGQGGNGEVK